MRIDGIWGIVIFLVVLLLLVSFALTLLPYMLLIWGIWYVYAKLIRPLWSRMTGEPTRTEDFRREPPQEAPVMDQQVKSVQDEEFFQQSHHVVEVDYEEEK